MLGRRHVTGRHEYGAPSADLDAPLWETPARPAGAETLPAQEPAGPEDLTIPDWEPRDAWSPQPEDLHPEIADPPETGWRRMAWRAGAHWVGPGGRERRHRDLAAEIRRPVSSPKVIAVLSPKGGVGKSTTAAALGGVLARMRGDLVAALDADPDAGNLVTFLGEPGSAFGAGGLHRDADQVARYGDLAPYLTRSESGLCVVRSNPVADGRLGPAEYRHLLKILARFYSIIVVDLGMGMREPAFRAVMETSDGVVAVTGPTPDAAEVLMDGLEWLSGRFPSVIRTATAVINEVEPPPGGVDMDRMAEALEDRVAEVVRVPHDAHLAHGGGPQWAMLGQRTQDAYLELAATVVDALPGGADVTTHRGGDR
jgi:MinD-like ATPase involved in chromosome partitioning or flagellar assembly